MRMAPIIYLNSWSRVSGTVSGRTRECSLVEEGEHVTGGFKFQKPMPGPVSFFVLPTFRQDASS